jgi:uncharacterized protein (TIGR03086 family)
VARDVVRHLTEWVPGFLTLDGVPPVVITADVDEDPAAAWVQLRDQLQAMLDDDALAGSEITHPQVGTHRLEDAVTQFVTSDVFMHTWDLARATGQPEQLDEDVAAAMLLGMQPADEMIRGEHFGPKVEPPPGADATTKLMAFVGRQV